MTTDRRVATIDAGPVAGWRAVAAFLALAYGLSWWPALSRLGNPDAAVVIPIGPSIAGLIVVGWTAGRAGRRRLLASTVDHQPVAGAWWALLLPPVIGAAAVALHLGSGGTRPTAGDLGSSALMFVVLPLTAIVGGPLGEELGWRGFLLPHLLRRRSATTATLLLLPMWLLFHLPLTLAHPGRYGLLWAANVTGIAFAMTWLHLRTAGSVGFAVAFHAVANTSTGAAVLLFPEDERTAAWAIVAGLWLAVAALAVLGPLRRADGGPALAGACPWANRSTTKGQP
jgi:membrane protease YdiL (CAAX protease family)